MEEVKNAERAWIPQFKISAEMAPDDVGEGIYEARQRLKLELFSAPISQGTILVVPNPEEDVVIRKPFYVAITHNEVDEALEAPLLVAKIDV